MNVRLLLASGVIGTSLSMSGCSFFHPDGESGGERQVIQRNGRPPEYSEVAREFNRTVDFLDRVSARANILLTYFDEDGKEHHEDPEGRLQIVRPNKLALSLGKAGQVLFWFGCDPEQYWWIDVADKDKRIAAVGRHEKFDDATAARIGLPIKPLDLIRVLGIVKMDPSVQGATQWSNDGQYIGVTAPVGDRGFQRTWLDPKTYRPASIEIFNRAREMMLVAEHSGDEPVEITRDIPGAGLAHVRMPSRVEITHLKTDTKARITLTGIKDGPISDKAFMLPILLEKYPVDKTIDLDARKRQ